VGFEPTNTLTGVTRFPIERTNRRCRQRSSGFLARLDAACEVSGDVDQERGHSRV